MSASKRRYVKQVEEKVHRIIEKEKNFEQIEKPLDRQDRIGIVIKLGGLFVARRHRSNVTTRRQQG